MSWFSKGYERVKEVGQQIEAAMNQEYLPTFFLRAGEEARVTFLTDEPITFYEHFVKGLNRTFTCPGTGDCPLCALGNKPSFRGGYLIVDHRLESWKDKQTGEQRSRQHAVKVMKHGIRALQVLERKATRHGLLNHDWIICRTGEGNQTQYDFENEELSKDFPLPEKMPSLEEVLKPKDRDYLLRQIAQAGLGQPNLTRFDVKDEEEGIIPF